MKITNRFLSQGLITLCLVVFCMPSWSQQLSAYKVTLKGWGFLEDTKSIFEDGVRLCGGVVIPSASPPPGEEVLSEIQEVYYTLPAVTVKSKITSYLVGSDLSAPPSANAPCRLEKKINEKTVVFSHRKPCWVNDKKLTAGGGCPEKNYFLEQTKPVQRSKTINFNATGESEVIAGVRCHVYRGSLGPISSKSCIFTEGLPPLSQFSDTGGIGGILMSFQQWHKFQGRDKQIIELKATSLEGPIMVDLNTIAPYLAGGHNISRY